jgi:hypothetical protein
MATIADITDPDNARTLTVYFPHPTDANAALPGSLQVFPCLVILPTLGTQQYSAGGPNVEIHRLQMTLYVTQQVLPEAYNIATPYIKLIRDKLAGSVTLSGLVDHCLPDSQADFYNGPGGIKYGEQNLLGIIFKIEVKQKAVFTVA